MATVAELKVRIAADIKAFQQGMSKVQGQMDQVGNNLRQVGSNLTKTVTLPILGIAGAAIKAASDAEEMAAKFDVVFKTVGTSVKRDIDAFSEAVGRSKYEMRGLAAGAGDLFKPLGYAEAEAGKLSVQLVKLAVDLSSFNNMTVDEAMQRLQSTLVGSHESALAFKVVINEAALKQELMRMGADKLTGAQLNQAKVQARLNLLMKGTVDAQGDAERTSGSFANQMRQLTSSINEVAVEIGDILMPQALELVGMAKDLTTRFKTLPKSTQENVVRFGEIAAATGVVTWTMGALLNTVKKLSGWILVVARSMTPLSAVLLLLSANILLVVRKWDTIRLSFYATKTAAENLVTDLGTTFKKGITGVMDSIATAITGDWEAAWKNLRITTNDTLQGIIDDGNMFFSTKRAIQENAPDPWGIGFMTAQAGQAVEDFRKGVEERIDTNVDSANAQLDKFKSKFIDLGKVKPDLNLIYGMFTGSENSLASHAGNASGAIEGIGTNIKLLDGINPNLGPLFGNFSGETGSIVSHSFQATDALIGIKSNANALSLIAPDMSNLNYSVTDAKIKAEEAKEKYKEFVDELKKELGGKLPISELPSGLQEIIDEAERQRNRISPVSEAFRVLDTNLAAVKTDADSIATAFDNIYIAVDRLGVDSDSKVYKAFKSLAVAGSDLSIFVSGLQGLSTLLNPATYTTFISNVTGAFSSMANLLKLAGDNVVKLFTGEKGFSDWVTKLQASDSPIANITGSLLKWAPAVGVAVAALSAFGIDLKDVLNGVKDTISKIGTGIANIFGKQTEAQKKAAAMKRFLSDVAKLDIDLEELDAIGKKAIESLMTPILTAGTATRDELLAYIGLTAQDMQRNLSDAFGLIQLEAERRGDTAFDGMVMALINNVGEILAQEFGTTSLDVMTQLADFLGVDLSAAQARAAQLLSNLSNAGVTVDPDGELGFALGGPDKNLSAGFDLGQVAGAMIEQIKNSTGAVMSNLAAYSGFTPDTSAAAMTPGGQTININLDGRTIAQATMPYWSQELEIYGTNR